MCTELSIIITIVYILTVSVSADADSEGTEKDAGNLSEYKITSFF